MRALNGSHRKALLAALNRTDPDRWRYAEIPEEAKLGALTGKGGDTQSHTLCCFANVLAYTFGICRFAILRLTFLLYCFANLPLHLLHFHCLLHRKTFRFHLFHCLLFCQPTVNLFAVCCIANFLLTFAVSLFRSAVCCSASVRHFSSRLNLLVLTWPLLSSCSV